MYKIAVLMDPIENVNPRSDSTIIILEKLQKKADIFYIEPDSLALVNSNIEASISKLKVSRLKKNFYTLTNKKKTLLTNMDALFFRTDPPVDDHYLNIAHILKVLENKGILIINSPSAISLMNEKILGDCFSPENVPSIVSNNKKLIKKFMDYYNTIVLKPMNLMAGKNIFKTSKKDKDFDAKLNLAQNKIKKNYIIAQKYLDVEKHGDMRVIIYNGKVYNKGLLRFPKKGEFRANLACGGNYKIASVEKSMLKHLEITAGILKSNGIYLAGVDIIDKYITEINITSPTGIVQLDKNNANLAQKISNELFSLIKMNKDGR
mgnify:FL=1